MSEEIPEGWAKASLEDLLYRPLAYGVLKPGGYVPNGVPILRIQDIRNRILTLSSLHRISKELDDEFKRTKLNAGDLIISLVGTIGKTLIVPKTLDGANISRAFGVIGIKPEYESIFIKQSLDATENQRWIIEQSQGNAQKVLNLGVLRQLQVKLPPKPEQQKLASILTSVDEVIAKTEAQISKLQDLKKGMMQDLLTKGIGHTEFKDSPVGRIPKGWELVTLGDITLSSAFGPRFSSDLYSDDGSIGCIRTTDFDDRWEIDYSTVPRANLGLSEFRSHILKDGDLLITRSGTCGVVDVFKEQPFPMVPGAFLIRFTLFDKANPHFIRYLLTTTHVQEKVRGMASGGVQKNLSGSNLKTLNLPLPGKDEQASIVSVLLSADARISSVSKKLQHMQFLKKSLMQDLLTGKVRVKVN